MRVTAVIDDSTHTFLSVLAFEQSLLWGTLPIQEKVFHGLKRTTDDGYWHLHFFFSKHSTLPGVNKIWAKTAPFQSSRSLTLSEASTLKRGLKLLRTLFSIYFDNFTKITGWRGDEEGEGKGGWVNPQTEKVCVYKKQQQQQQQQNKQIKKRTTNIEQNTKIPKLALSSFSISSFSISLLVHEQK